MRATEMASLFDVDLQSNLENHNDSDETTSVTEESVSTFEEKSKDLFNRIEPEPDIVNIPTNKNTDTETILSAIVKSAKETKTSKKEPKVIAIPPEPTDMSGKINKFIDEEMDKHFAGECCTDNSSEEDNDSDSESTENTVLDIQPASSDWCKEENPLALDGLELRAYKEIKAKYPMFSLYNGILSYRDFYKAKLNWLTSLLTRWPLLDLSDMSKEIHACPMDHYIGENDIHVELLSEKLDDAYRVRTRVVALLMQAHEQYFSWKRSLDLLKSKLWKDHDMKGAHRREGLVEENLSDIEKYLGALEGFIEIAKSKDTMLKAASDTLSRQLTCLQMSIHISGGTPKITHDHHISDNSEFSGLDTIGDNEFVPKMKESESPIVDFGFSASIE